MSGKKDKDLAGDNCVICQTMTENYFNIDLQAVRICEGCADAIFIQQAIWYTKNNNKNNEK